ncbi:retinal guanylyl cyclase 1 [Lycorma delicatula]|uniref:retinal guanylyl cyclase 1 n=1 Tax=Lycorma delicatula TaxID=130591 RepID=UPI003F514C60
MFMAGALSTIIAISFWLSPSLAGSRIILIICPPPPTSFDITSLLFNAQELIHLINTDWELHYHNTSGSCDAGTSTTSLSMLEMIEAVIEDRNTVAIFATIPSYFCPMAERIAYQNKKPIITLSCPQSIMEERSVIGLAPPHDITATSLLEIFKHFRWKTISIITSELGWWPRLALRIEAVLKGSGVGVRHHIVLPPESTASYISDSLLPLKQAPSRAVILCMPIDSLITQRIVFSLEKLQAVTLPSTAIVFLNLDYPFHVHIGEMIISSLSFNLRKAVLLLTASCVSGFTDQFNVSHNETLQAHLGYWCLLKNSITALNYTINNNNNSGNISDTILLNNQRHILLDWLEVNNSNNNSNSSNSNNNKTEIILQKENLSLLGSFTGKWRSLIVLDWSKTDTFVGNGKRVELRVEPLVLRSREWARLKNQMASTVHYSSYNTDDPAFCEDEVCAEGNYYGIFPRGIHIISIFVCSILSLIILIFAAILARRQYLKKQMSKGPCKILLTPADFVFPHGSDTRRVDEGIETMLCCWLQQLQEFGGPEVEKPDLLKGSVGSLHSVHSLNKPVISDPRARYNGDLVQLKALPCQGGTFELKNKSMDVLISLHGLRHENLNPLIGCLMEPTRPALVWEWCSRGSLEDVLIQDEIKLDWSFRLSLLTDLVRGLRYLHSVPHRVHGNLTSRNCVIDARWVLKLTDYCLPSFYASQNIAPSQKTARDLLWTAPELLRSESLRLQGTQPGDVYSFGIIMQEVVVRGEPFCMLALSPEEIIEKVKKPPPLIRPSVSKGAAPPEAINIMRQCWAEQADMRPDMNAVYDLFKTLNHGRKVNFVDTMFQMLEKYSNNLEDLIRERTEQLDMEKKKTEQLLNRMLPSSVAEKLKLGMPVDPEDFSEVTIYFSDIVGFTTISAYSTPFEVVDLLNDLYTCFDATINAYNVYKVETIGDAYMVVGGLPVRITDHADQVATMALDLLHQSGQFKIRHLPYTPLRLRIGLHTGPCCAGVVGLTMPRYCLFGDTVNTASRMESSGSAWRIHISAATKEKLDEASGYCLEYRGETELKGKGKMHTYWLLGKQGFNKELPSPPPIGLDERLILYGRTGGPVEAAGTSSSGARTPKKFKSEDSNSSFELNDVLNINQTTLTPTKEKDKSSRPNLIYQLSLDPGLLVENKINKNNDNNELLSIDNNSCSNINNRKRWSSRRQMTFDHGGSSSSMMGGHNFDQDDQRFCSNKNVLSVIKNTSDSLDITSSNNKGNINNELRSSTSIRSGISTPLSTSDFNVDILGVSFVNTSKSSSNLSSMNLGHRRIGSTGGVTGGSGVDVNDLSTPYNHYRCLSPSNGKSITSGTRTSNLSSRFLKRQFSMDREDILSSEPQNIKSSSHNMQSARLFKQNSAGAAHDLERIEEIPSSLSSSYKHRSNLPIFSSHSASVESLN